MAIPVGFQRLLPWFGYHHLLMCFNVAAIIMVAVMSAGCSSSSAMSGLYVTQLSYAAQDTSSTSSVNDLALSNILASARGSAGLELRVNYFGLCMRPRGPFWICSPSGSDLIEELASGADPLGVVSIGSQFKDRALFSGFWLMGIATLSLATVLLGTFPGWHYERDELTGDDVEVKPFPSRPVTMVALALSGCASFSFLVSSLWQHVAAVVMQYVLEATGYGSFNVSIGTAVMVLGWASFAFSMVTTIGLWSMILSMNMLDQLTGS